MVLRGNCDVLVSVTVMVLEREAMAGGIPRHCGHPPFGWQEFHRILTGPKYASRLVKSAESEGVDIRVQVYRHRTGARPRLARVNSRRNASCENKTNCFDHRCSGNSQSGAHGLRQPADGRSDHRCAAIHGIPQITQAIQASGHRGHRVGVIFCVTDLSACGNPSCRHGRKTQSPNCLAEPLPGLQAIQGVRTLMNTEVTCIEGKDRVSGVILRNDTGREEHISCDGVVFTGKFVSESTLARLGSLEINPVSGIPGCRSIRTLL